MAQGYQCLVLHAHLPYIRHPEYESFLEENWLFEAITETYLPLLQMLWRRLRAGHRHCLTLSLSPTLLSMLRDPFLQGRYRAHMTRMRRLAQKEVERTRGDTRFAVLAQMYRERLDEVTETYESLNGDLVGAFVELHDNEVLELITTAASHGFLPLLKSEPFAVRAQLQTGAKAFQEMTGIQARGVWLPECGYYQGLEAMVEEAGFGYFFVDSHGILNATPRPYYELSAPLLCPNGVAAFGRDPESSRQVWSRTEGYPGDFWYRDFYRDIGFDLELDYVRPYILDGETRIFTGFKYYRITGHDVDKAVYEPERARERLRDHARDFVGRCERAIAAQGPRSGPAPVLTSPYDAELFGHWWFEAVEWLEAVIEGMASTTGDVALTTPSTYLAAYPELQVAVPSSSSWGDGGYNAFWLNEGNDWVYPHLHDAARRMQALVGRHHDATPGSLTYRVLQQAGRSLLLAQASDWAFIMKTGTSREYAYNRTRDHLARFNYLEQSLHEGGVDERSLQALEVMDHIFAHISPRDFR